MGEDGASQQSIEDLALATSLPHFTVIVPADEVSTEVLVKKLAARKGPVFMRTGRPKVPIIYKQGTDFEIGKGIKLRKGGDVTIFAIGLLVFEALQAAEELAEKGIQAAVVDLHTVKPIDRDLIRDQAKETGAVVACEEHQIYGGLGSIVSEVVTQEAPVPMEFVAIRDTYAESGTPDELLNRYGLTAHHIVQAAERILKRKKK